MSLDELLATADQASAAALKTIIDLVRAAVPAADEGVSYGVPVLRAHGKALIGLRRNTAGYALYPFSAAVTAAVAGDLPDHSVSTGAIRFTAAHPIPATVVARIVELRLAEIAGGQHVVADHASTRIDEPGTQAAATERPADATRTKKGAS